MLDGQGGDELFGGYRYFIAGRAASLMRRGKLLAAARLLRNAGRLPRSGQAPGALWHALGLLLPSSMRNTAMRVAGIAPMPRWLDRSWFEKRGVTGAAPRQADGPSYLSEQLLLSLRETSLPALLRYEDRNSMALGIESRVPFLTTELADFALSLPEHFFVGPAATPKRLLRIALRDLVPEEILARRDKIGFATPERLWLTGMRDAISHVLASGTAAGIAALCADEMQADWQAALAGQRPLDFRFWRWANLIHWAQRRNVVFD
jgi:asparagine synthase (glutamine-hydrolysing)